MKANPGGQIQGSDVVGRDGFIANLWRVLEGRSVVLTAERRMGKTCIIKNKMSAEPPPGKRPIYRDLEPVRTPLEFVEIVFRDVEEYLSRRQRYASRVRAFLRHLGGTEFQGLKLPEIAAQHWKTLLQETVADLSDQQEQTIIFLWDEMPLMLYNIRQAEGERLAMELLDTLRSLRQTHSNIRMLFTGSIGLHIVLSSLKHKGYANDPTNDMDSIEVPPLEHEDAEELSRLLLSGENVRTDNAEDLAHAIALSVDGIPYFIHHVVNQIVHRGGAASVKTVAEILDESLTDPNDRWHLGYYCERISTYYGSDEGKFAFEILDVLATREQAIGFAELFNLLKSRLPTEDAEMARGILSLLKKDHYIVQQPDGLLRFRFPLIQRCWRLHRGLAL